MVMDIMSKQRFDYEGFGTPSAYVLNRSDEEAESGNEESLVWIIVRHPFP